MATRLAPEATPAYLAPLVDALRTATAHQLTRLAPPEQPRRRSAVLVLIADIAGGPDVLLTERASNMRSHNAQVSFPGGGADPGDSGPVSTALREANEEVGLDPAVVTPLARMPDLYIPVTGYAVTPILATGPARYDVSVRSPREVARVARVALRDLADPETRFTVRTPSGYSSPAFDVDGLFVWGFTAGVLSGVLEMGGFAQPWDRDVVRPIPKRFLS